ncbi:glutathione S-transferase family protein [Sphaerothrix gracilis]|uniref:glutathione S-transferase family protein n=1 Tax=Sphaerothrix gracilis TaxID=3151835 RepID=UPI0031FC6CE7
MAKLTLYGTPDSTYVRTTRLLLEEAEIDYDLESVGIFNGENETADYLAKNPFGKVPTLDIGGELLYETAAIAPYLDAVFASTQFTPAEPVAQARMRQVISIVDSYLYAPAVGSIVIQRLIVPQQGGQADEAEVKAAVEPAQKAVNAIEAIAVGNPYVLGDRLSLADFYLMPIFKYLSQTPEFESVMAEAPKLKAWWQKVQELPSFQKVCAA